MNIQIVGFDVRKAKTIEEDIRTIILKFAYSITIEIVSGISIEPRLIIQGTTFAEISVASTMMIMLDGLNTLKGEKLNGMNMVTAVECRFVPRPALRAIPKVG